MKTLSIKFYLKEDSLNKKGTMKLYCQLLYEREKRTFALPYRLHPDQWNAAKERTHEDEALNEELVWMESRLMEIKRQLTYQGKRFTTSDLVNLFLNRKADHVRLYVYMAKAVEEISRSEKHAPGTKKSYQSKTKIIEAFLRHEKKMDLPINEVDIALIHKFENWMTNQRSKQYGRLYKRGTVNKLHQIFSTILNMAKRDDLIKTNPYEKFRFPRNESSDQPKYLTEEELAAIVAHDLGGNESLQRVRDFFVFCCFTGLRFNDAMHLEKHHVRKEKRKGRERFIIELIQQKTGNKVVIPLFGLAETLYLKQLEGDMYQLTGRLFVPLSNVKVNSYLKVIGDLCGIDKGLHHHMARHTAGTYLLSKGVPEAHVSAILGHRSTAMTRRYAKVLKGSLLDVIDEMEKQGS